jgi:polyisoprenoid-binding protein YceI
MGLRKHWKIWLVGVVVAAVVLIVGVPFAYINLFESNQPAALTLDTTPSQSQSSAGGTVSADGTWKVAAGSQAGYRVHEVLAGQSVTAVGRGTGVTGSLAVSGTNVTTGSFTVDMTAIKSDRTQRDERFLSIVDTASHPTATFALTKPIALGSIPAAGTTISATATGNLTVHGVTKPVTVPIKATRSGDSIKVQGAISVTFADYGVQAPNIGGFVKVDPTGEVEFLLTLTK